MPRKFLMLAVGIGVGLTLAVAMWESMNLVRSNIPVSQVPKILLRRALNDLGLWGGSDPAKR